MTSAAIGPTDTRLGPAFGRLWAAAIASNLADGLGRTAIPLIATTLTRDPLLISAVTAVAYLPWLLFGLPAGILLDRIDRRVAMGAANGLRVLMALVVAVSITTGTMSIWLLYACILIWGVGETVFDTGTNAVLPSTVKRGGLEKANGRIQGAQLVVDTFIGAPLAGLMFAAAIALPIWSTAAGFAVSGVLALVLPVAVARAAADVHGDEPVEGQAGGAEYSGMRRVRHEAAESLRFLWHHRLLRGVLAITTLVGGLLSFGQASMVLFFLHTMSVSPALLGVITAVVGVGALVGAMTASTLVRWMGRAKVMWSTTLLAGVTLALVGISPNLATALISYAISAFAIAVWNVPWSALRQELIPGRMLGRTIGFIRSLTWGIIPVATILGGLLARFDLRLPFVLGGAGIVIVVLIGSRLLFAIDRAPRPYASSASSSSNSSGSPVEG